MRNGNGRDADGGRGTSPRNRLRAVPTSGANGVNPSAPEEQESRSAVAAEPGVLPRGRKRLALIRDLAMGEWNEKSLAKQYGLPVEDISAFQEDYQEEIQELAAALAGTIPVDTAGLWTTRKQNRIAEFQQAIEDIDEVIISLRQNGVPWSRAHRDMFRARLDYYRQIADELGAYPQRQAAPVRQGNTVHYIIETDETDSMT